MNKIYGKYQANFSAFTFFDTGNPKELKGLIDSALREIGCHLIFPSFKTKLIVELDKPKSGGQRGNTEKQARRK